MLTFMLHTGSIAISDFILRNGIFTVVLELYVRLSVRFKSWDQILIEVAVVAGYDRPGI